MDRDFFDEGIGVVPPSSIDVDAVMRRQRRTRRIHRLSTGVAVAVAVAALGATTHLALANAGPSATHPSATPLDAGSSSIYEGLVSVSDPVKTLRAALAAVLPTATITLKAVPVKPVGFPDSMTMYEVDGFITTTSGGVAHVTLTMSRPAADPSTTSGDGTYGASTMHADGTELTIKVMPLGTTKPPLTGAQMKQIVADPALTFAMAPRVSVPPNPPGPPPSGPSPGDRVEIISPTGVRNDG
jgi:hypothetical protein